jgi:hypothetical protein
MICSIKSMVLQFIYKNTVMEGGVQQQAQLATLIESNEV